MINKRSKEGAIFYGVFDSDTNYSMKIRPDKSTAFNYYSLYIDLLKKEFKSNNLNEAEDTQTFITEHLKHTHVTVRHQHELVISFKSSCIYSGSPSAKYITIAQDKFKEFIARYQEELFECILLLCYKSVMDDIVLYSPAGAGGLLEYIVPLYLKPPGDDIFKTIHLCKWKVPPIREKYINKIRIMRGDNTWCEDLIPDIVNVYNNWILENNY